MQLDVRSIAIQSRILQFSGKRCIAFHFSTYCSNVAFFELDRILDEIEPVIVGRIVSENPELFRRFMECGPEQDLILAFMHECARRQLAELRREFDLENQALLIKA